MKEQYEAPELWLIGLVPGRQIAAADWQWDLQVEGESTGISEVEGEIGNNPEGSFK